MMSQHLPTATAVPSHPGQARQVEKSPVYSVRGHQRGTGLTPEGSPHTSALRSPAASSTALLSLKYSLLDDTYAHFWKCSSRTSFK